MSLLEEIPSKPNTIWKLFSKEEFISFIKKRKNSLTPEPDKLLWRYLKRIVKEAVCLRKFINIADTYIDLGHWPLYLKVSISIIISKPNKELYNSSKAFRLIILLNMIGKLIEKVISKRLQF